MNNLFPTSISPDAAALDILERMPVMEHDDIEDKLAFAISSHGMNDEDINRLCSVLSYRLFIIEKEHEHFLDFTHQYNGLFAVKKKGYVKSVLDCFMRHKKMVLPLITIIQRLAPPALHLSEQHGVVIFCRHVGGCLCDCLQRLSLRACLPFERVEVHRSACQVFRIHRGYDRLHHAAAP